MYQLKIRAVGSSSGTVLPKELLAELGVQQGDTVCVTRAPDGSFRLTPYDETFDEQMAVAEDIARTHRDVFRALSKR